MKSEFTISEDDYVGAMRLFARFTSKRLWIVVLILLLLGLVALFASEPLKSGALGGLIGGGIVLVLNRYLLAPLIARRNYRKYRAIQQPIQLELKEDGLLFTTADGGGLVRWENIFMWRHNERYLLLYPMPRLYYIIPKRIASAGFDLNALQGALEANLGDAR